MSVIFFFSYQPAPVSNELSKGITEQLVQLIETIFPHVEMEINQFNSKVRKLAHFLNFLVFGIVVMFAVRRIRVFRKKSVLIAFLICTLFAITDEVHQLFVPGRGAQLQDVLIDSTGACVGIGLYLFVSRIRK